MKRWWLVAGLFLVAWAVVATAQVTLPGYTRDDIQLISQESLPTWSARWTGPIEAATNLAWFAHHGYTKFVRDYNGDGVINETDTIQLADELGRTLMGTDTERGTTDVRLVLGLAQYIAGLYPNEFVLKIYDLGFPSEMLAEGFGTFSPTMVPGVLLELKAQEPNITAYETEMRDAEGVILGLSEAAGQNNTYLAGRSFLFDATAEGYTPIDLAWSEEDLWQSGHQGQVLQTVGEMTDRFYLSYKTAWTPVEFMLALSPQQEPEVRGKPQSCPSNALASDTTVTATAYGHVSITECVTRQQVIGGPTLDTYTYYVTNIDFTYGTCGICMFYIPNPLDYATTTMTGPTLWMVHAGWGGWWWSAPTDSCGILPGETGVFSVTIVGPSTDVAVDGAVGACVAGASPNNMQAQPPVLNVQTTGPGQQATITVTQSGSNCPDLVVRIESASCSSEGRANTFTIKAIVTNIGGAMSNATFAQLDTPIGTDTGIVSALAPGASDEVIFSVTSAASGNYGPVCSIEFTVTVDPYYAVKECNEQNNTATGTVTCASCR